MTKKISKILSLNDTGESGGHQAGILVPKEPEILGFFPKLGKETKNPRVGLVFTDESGEEWEFTFIYYNNKFYAGTRNEFRLTGMTRFFRENGLKAGDELFLASEGNGNLAIGYKRQVKPEQNEAIRLKGQWKVIKI